MPWGGKVKGCQGIFTLTAFLYIVQPSRASSIALLNCPFICAILDLKELQLPIHYFVWMTAYFDILQNSWGSFISR